ncbi:MAG: diguanylate cyclase [Candidatus Omnitrophica bacterium]|nr:diguanylate cyclase [Candidatus Omnitrophota bacterium]
MKLDAKLYKMVLDNLHDGVYVLDKDKKIVFWNKAAEKITGYSEEEVLGAFCSQSIFSNITATSSQACFGLFPVIRALSDGKVHEEELYLNHKDGRRIPVYSRAVPITGRSGEVTGAMEVFIDKSVQMSALFKIAELEALTLIDPLTRVGNRKYTENIIRTRLNELERYKWPFGILFIDLDDFKKINDTYNHDVGDRMLQMVTKIMLSNCRLSDFVGRWGGDEFIAVIVNVDSIKLKLIAARFRILIERLRLKIGEKEVNITASIGASLAKIGDAKEELIRRADTLMYKSKLAGKNTVTIDT